MDQPTHRSRELLNPPLRGWMVVTLLVAIALDLVPRHWFGWGPEALLLTLTFWALRAPAWCGFGLALLLGLAVDVGRGAVLGQTALAAIWLVWGVQTWRPRLLWFGPWGQAAHLVWLWAAVLLLQVAVRWVVVGEIDHGRGYWLAPLWMALLWPLWHGLLLWPQRVGGSVSPP
jgi:rod shape-determining protein MreD